jgi:signal transduction protein with GAF and PtsI domain
VAAVRRLYDAAACSCALVDEAGETLTFVASDGVGAEQITGVSRPVSRGIAGWAVMSGQPLAVRDVAADARFARDVAESTSYVPTSILAAPMFDGSGEAMGVLSVLDPGIDQASDWTLAVLGTLATQISLVASASQQPGGADLAGLADLGRRVLELSEGYRR